MRPVCLHANSPLCLWCLIVWALLKLERPLSWCVNAVYTHLLSPCLYSYICFFFSNIRYSRASDFPFLIILSALHGDYLPLMQLLEFLNDYLSDRIPKHLDTLCMRYCIIGVLSNMIWRWAYFLSFLEYVVFWSCFCVLYHAVYSVFDWWFLRHSVAALGSIMCSQSSSSSSQFLS